VFDINIDEMSQRNVIKPASGKLYKGIVYEH